MRLSRFIEVNIEEILGHWDDFARTMGPAAATMSAADFRDHAREILLSIVQDMNTEQDEPQREAKSKAVAGSNPVNTSAGEHGVMRQKVGFDLIQLGAEYRALRATVLRLWAKTVSVADAATLEDVMRFNESMDRSLAESLATYSAAMSSSRDTFLAVLGHDLRNPLDALNSCIKLVSLSEDKAQMQRAIRIAGTSISTIKTMIADLLEYTRSRLGKGIEVIPKRNDLAALCREVIEEVTVAYPQRAFKADIPQHVPATIDAPRMRQVLTNLLTNAVQHGNKQFPIHLVVEQETASVVMHVKNRGNPIPADALQVIFNPLVQIGKVDLDGHERFKTSLGLGLYIAKEIVTQHGGTLKVTSSAAEGTVFSIIIKNVKNSV